MLRLACLLLTLALPAVAQDLPFLGNVSGVASNDVLNIREEPRASSAIIGTLPPGAEGVEVVAIRDGWGQINSNGRTGWLSLRYIAPQPEAEFPGLTQCHGTEPFWNIIFRQGRVIYNDPSLQASGGGQTSGIDLGAAQRLRAMNDASRHGIIAATGGTSLRAIVTRQSCSDGMSDHAYALSVAAFLDHAGETQLLSGCCSIAPR